MNGNNEDEGKEEQEVVEQQEDEKKKKETAKEVDNGPLTTVSNSGTGIFILTFILILIKFSCY